MEERLIGERLKEERIRLGKNQTEFAQIAAAAGASGTTRQSQSLYEKGDRMPDATYLAAVAEAGVDVSYVLTGERGGKVALALRPDEELVLEGYRQLDARGRAGVMALIGGMSPPAAKKQVTVSAQGGHAAGRDLVIGAERTAGKKKAK